LHFFVRVSRDELPALAAYLLHLHSPGARKISPSLEYQCSPARSRIPCGFQSAYFLMMNSDAKCAIRDENKIPVVHFYPRQNFLPHLALTSSQASRGLRLSRAFFLTSFSNHLIQLAIASDDVSCNSMSNRKGRIETMATKKAAKKPAKKAAKKKK
jgi:hypothetical protein